MVPTGCKTSASTVEGEPGLTHVNEGSANRSDPTTDVNCDPALQPKILLKMEALRERLMLWTRRLNELVCALG